MTLVQNQQVDLASVIARSSMSVAPSDVLGPVWPPLIGLNLMVGPPGAFLGVGVVVCGVVVCGVGGGFVVVVVD